MNAQTKVSIRNISAGNADIMACNAMNILKANQAQGQVTIRTKAHTGKVAVYLTNPNQTVVSQLSKLFHQA